MTFKVFKWYTFYPKIKQLFLEICFFEEEDQPCLMVILLSIQGKVQLNLDLVSALKKKSSGVHILEFNQHNIKYDAN